MENRKYTASFILDMRNSSETIEGVMTRLQNTISALGGTVSESRNLGQKSFEYVVDRKFPNGIYLQIDFEGSSVVPASIKSKLALDKTVNRVLIEFAA